VARSMLPGRSLDPGSNARARGMITLPDFGETELGLQNPASANPPERTFLQCPSMNLKARGPRLGETSFVHPTAVLIGGVTIGENCYIGPGAVLRGDFGYIEIGDGSNVQEKCGHPYLSRTDRPARPGQPHRP